jgi:diacylglycerol O-acyltransferase
MPQSEPRRRMTGADAMFLYFERKEMPLHIGCVAILDGPLDAASEKALADRLHEIPRYRQRVVFSPFNLTHPTWEDDPNFDIRNHVRRLRIEPPGTERQLSELSGILFSTLMDRSKPLWDMTVVDGIEGGRSALIVRVHHSLVDGVSGVALVNTMFDPTREPRVPKAEPYEPPPLPDSKKVLVEGLASTWADAAARLIGSEVAVLRLVQAFTGDSSRANLRSLMGLMPELLRPAQKLPFNGPCSGVRGHCWTTFPFAEARAIRSALGGTINDVLLTAVAGAVSRYVIAHREPVEGRFVRLMVPVNLRAGEPDGVGNEISLIPLSIPLDIENPVERMKAITKRSAAMKSARIADVIQLIGMGLGWTPPALQESLAALPFLPQPVLLFNMVCTNVPGPMIPLYANGRELLTYYPHVPCGSDVGISVAISSYNRSLYCGVTYDAQAAPDGELFRDFVAEAYEELRSAAGVAGMPATPPAPAQELKTPKTAKAKTQPAAEAVAPEPEAQPEVSAILEPASEAVDLAIAATAASDASEAEELKIADVELAELLEVEEKAELETALQPAHSAPTHHRARPKKKKGRRDGGKTGPGAA